MEMQDLSQPRRRRADTTPTFMDHPNSPRNDRCGVAWQDLGGHTFAEIQHLEEQDQRKKKAWSCCGSRRDASPEPDLEAPKLGSAKLWQSEDVPDSDEEAKAEPRREEREEPSRGEWWRSALGGLAHRIGGAVEAARAAAKDVVGHRAGTNAFEIHVPRARS